jgi:hypothetical protein
MPGPCEPIDSVAHRRLLRDMLAYKDHADDARLFVLDHYRLIGSMIGTPSIPPAEAAAGGSKVQDKGR